jgi:hypothetical protein
MDQLNILFNIEEDSKIDYGYSLIINGESGSDSDSSPDNETPSDSGPSIGPSNLGPYMSPSIGSSDLSNSSTTSSHPPKSIKGSHFHSVGTQMLALTRKRDGIPIHLITQETGMSKSAIYKVQEKAISRGWSSNPIDKQVVEPFHVDDAPRPGLLRPWYRPWPLAGHVPASCI